jgi:predicted secreted protein
VTSWDYLPKLMTLALGLGLALAGTVWAGNVQPAVTLTDKDHGRSITLKVGETLALTIEQPGATGFQVLPPVFQAGVLKLVRHQEDPPLQVGRPRLGAPIRHHYEFQVVGAGRTELLVQIARPWEKERPPQELFRATIVGRP